MSVVLSVDSSFLRNDDVRFETSCFNDGIPASIRHVSVLVVSLTRRRDLMAPI